MRLLWGSSCSCLMLLLAWIAHDPTSSSVNATITLALDATQLALASGLLGAASVAGLGFVKGLVKGKALGDSSYGPPDATYGVPESSYGIVESSYGAPDSSYGTPDLNYGAPEPTYGAPHHTYATPDYSPAPSYTTTPEVSYSQPEKDEYGSPSAPAIVQLIKSEKLEEHPEVEDEHLHEDTVAEDEEVAKLEKEVADNLEKLEKLNLLRQKRQRQSTKGNVRFQHGRSSSWPQLSLPVLKLGSYRDYVARVRGLRVRGKREADFEQKNVKVSRGETGTDLRASIDQIFKEIRTLDAVDCGKVYVCEIAATPVTDRSEGEEAVIALLTVAGERQDAAQYRWAATIGQEEEGRKGCRLVFPRCPLAGLSQLVASNQ